MQYGAVEESGPQSSRGLRTLQIWCIVIAVYKLIFGDVNIFLQCAFVKGNNAGDIAIGVIAIILAIGHFFSNILLLVPSCKKEPQAAYGSRVLGYPFILIQIASIIFTIANFLFVYINQEYHMAAHQYSVNIFLKLLHNISIKVMVMVCAYYMLKDVQLQGTTPVGPPENKDTMQYDALSGPGQVASDGLLTMQKWSIAAAVCNFVLAAVNIGTLVPSTHVPSLLDTNKEVGIFIIIFVVGNLLSSVLLLIPSCMKKKQVAYKWQLLVVPFILIQVANIVFTTVIYSIFIFDRFGSQPFYIVTSLHSFSTDVAVDIGLLACAFYLKKDLQLQEQTPALITDNL